MTDNARRLIRYGAWLALAVAVALRVVLAYAGVPPLIEVIVGDGLCYLLPMALLAALGTALWVLAVRHGGERRGWAMIASASLLVLVSESYWSFYAALVDPNGPADWWTPVANASAMVLLFGFVTRMTWLGVEPFIRRARFYLDVVTVTLIAYPPVYLFWTLPVATRGGGASMGAVLAAYPIVGSIMALGSASIVVRASGWRRPAWDRLAALGVFAVGCALALYPVWYPDKSVVVLDHPDWYTLTLGAGIDVLAVALVYRLTADAEEVAFEPWPRPVQLHTWVTYLLHAIAVTALVAIGGFVYVNDDTVRYAPLRVVVLGLALVLAVRSWVAALERAGARRSADVDATTGAFSRRLLDTRLRELVSYSIESGHELSVVIFDFRDMRRADRLSGKLDDETPARTLVASIRRESVGLSEVFRTGSDRFTVLLPGEGEGSASAFALRVWLSEGRSGEAQRLSRLGVCAGVAVFPVHASDADHLLASAEVALTAARASDREPVAVFDESMTDIPEEERATREHMRELRATVRTLAEAVDARDPATRDHSSNVSELATALAQVLGLEDDRVQIVGLAALMHDIGKIGVRDEVLLKPGSLSVEERIEIEQHTVLGERILSPARLDDILPAVRSHHEWWDGSGYPDGLAGETIPLEARVLAVCDAFETMTTGRLYREARSVADALLEIETRAGTQFDPAVAGAFARMVRGLRARTFVHVSDAS